MASLEELFGTDRNLEAEGVWQSFGDAEIKIASALAGNPAFAKAQERVFRSKRRLIEADALPLSEFQKLTIEIYADAVVRDWRGVKFKGEELAFERANVIRILTELPALLDAIAKIASARSSFQAADLEADAKN